MANSVHCKEKFGVAWRSVACDNSMSGIATLPDTTTNPGTASRDDVTGMLKRASSGDQGCLAELIEVVYGDLHNIAAAALQRERRDHTWQPTTSVHEAYLRLVDQTKIEWQDRVHFFAIAARQMRRALIDHARARNAEKRGGKWHKVTLHEGDAAASGLTVQLLDLNDALEELARLKERHHRVVELRFFGGLSHAEIAHILGVSAETVKKDWQFARAWLHRRLQRSEKNDET